MLLAVDIYAPLPGPQDFAGLHDHLPQGSGPHGERLAALGYGVFLVRWLMLAWIARQGLLGPMPQ